MKFSKRRASFPPALKRGGGLHPKSPRPGSGMSLRHPSPPPASSFPRLLFLKSTKLHRPRPRISLAIGSSADSAGLSSTVGSPPPIELSQWSLGPRHIRVLNVAACVVAISTTWLFFSAIPSLLAFKRAAESMEKLLDVTAEELPDTMAAVRLSGMEISELTVELSDIGQEITQGVRRSTRTVRVAEDRLRQFATMAPTGASPPTG
ncbi:uncharacterized protein LOC109832640 isoform X2 [Asparagus officinalis]|uniref:uncharacterized protein LOC109832640 isoform X2 n=1 Tax=Asparagus officinalis TaxID=4686 RepID=UPI00098DFB97|nr:uncharacterized protein LOC109832640 isoform X2 [Asparagus officinalis]